ncbi:MAG: hypothetical protein L0H25_08000, partial [Micrococcales bacterium]|nr:hypothetical protein [Micrococcales bacterium]
MTPRVVEVAPERLDRWLAGFAERHGPIDAAEESTPGGIAVRGAAADGSAIVATPFGYEPLGLILVRRGGYAAGLAFGGSLGACKIGTRHVQSRTAAGGWSQQRFARRRAHQAEELVGAVIRHARRVLLGEGESPRRAACGIPQGMVLGGDRTLVRDVLADPALQALRGLPRREFYDLPDPRRTVLETALRRGRAYRV